MACLTIMLAYVEYLSDFRLSKECLAGHDVYITETITTQVFLLQPRLVQKLFLSIRNEVVSLKG